MNNVQNRANAVFFHSLTTMICIGMISAATVFNCYPHVVAKVTGHELNEFGLYTSRGIRRPVSKADLSLNLEGIERTPCCFFIFVFAS